MDVATETTRDPKSAGTNPETLKPFTNEPTNQKSPALTIKEKSPSVISVIGNAISKIIGLTTAFRIAKKNATSSAIPKELTSIPLIKEGSVNITKATSTHIDSIFIIIL